MCTCCADLDCDDAIMLSKQIATGIHQVVCQTHNLGVMVSLHVILTSLIVSNLDNILILYGSEPDVNWLQIEGNADIVFH